MERLGSSPPTEKWLTSVLIATLRAWSRGGTELELKWSYLTSLVRNTKEEETTAIPGSPIRANDSDMDTNGDIDTIGSPWIGLSHMTSLPHMQGSQSKTTLCFCNRPHTKMSGQARGDIHINSKQQATSRAPTSQQALKTQLCLSWDQSPWPVNSLISLKTALVPLSSPFSLKKCLLIS